MELYDFSPIENIKISSFHAIQMEKESQFFSENSKITKEEPKEESKEENIEKKFTRPDVGWAWMVAIASLFASMISDGVIFSFGVITPEFIKHFGISRSTVGWMGSLLISITLCVGPLAGYLCQKFGYRAVAIGGSMISAISFALPYFYSKVWFLFLSSSVVSGIGFGLVYFPSIVIVNVWFEKKRSLAMGIAVCGSGLGTFVFSPLLQLCIAKLGWQWTMLITGIMLLTMIPFCMTYIIRNGYNETEENEDEFLNAEKIKDKSRNSGEFNEELQSKSDEESTNQTKKTYLELLKNPIMWLFLISNIMTSIGFNTPYMFTKDRAMLQNISEHYASFLISAIGIGNCIGRLVFGYVSTRVSPFHVYNISLVVSGAVLVLSCISQNYYFMMFYSAFYGIMTGPYMVLLSIVLVDIFGLKNLDNTLSLTLLAQGFSVLVGPPISGMIFDLTDSFNITFVICGIFIVLSGMIMYLFYVFKDFRKMNVKTKKTKA